MASYYPNVFLTKERIEMLLKLDIPDPEFVKTLQHHLSRYNEKEWATLRVRFKLRTYSDPTDMYRWCKENLGDRNIVERRWAVVADHKTKDYRHIEVAFRSPADEIMFKMVWQDHLWTPRHVPKRNW